MATVRLRGGFGDGQLADAPANPQVHRVAWEDHEGRKWLDIYAYAENEHDTQGHPVMVYMDRDQVA